MPGQSRKYIHGAGRRLNRIRQQLKCSPVEMAARLGIGLNGYYKNEHEETIPSPKTLYQLQKEYGISMDWFLFGKGPERFKDKPVEETSRKEAETETNKSAAKEKVHPEIKDLLDHMEQDSLLRHEIMVYFYKYKEKKTNPAPTPPLKT